MNESITVKDILSLDVFKSAELVAGEKGLRRQIQSVSVIEIPNATAFYRGGELQISAFYAAMDNVDLQLKIIRNLEQSNCAGLVLCHFGTWMKEISQELIDLADELEFPIILASPQTAYYEIIMAISGLLIDSQASNLKYSLKIHNLMAKVILQDKDETYLLKVLEDLIERKVMFLRLGKKIISSRKFDDDDKDFSLLQRYINDNLDLLRTSKEEFSIGENEGFKNQLLFTPVISENDYYGHIVIFDAARISEMNRTAIMQGKTALAMISINRIHWSENLRNTKKEFLYNLLTATSADEKNLTNTAKRLQLNIDKIFAILVIDRGENEEWTMEEYSTNQVEDSNFKEVQNTVKNISPDSYFYCSGQRIIVYLVAPPEVTNDKQKEALIRSVMSLLGKNVGGKDTSRYVSCGGLCSGISSISISFNQAINAMNIGKILFPDKGTYQYSDLIIYHEMLKIAKKEEVRQEVGSLFETIQEHDHDGYLMETLEALLHYNLDTAQVANALFVHKNTVLHRKNKIIEILKYNPFEQENLIKFQIAMVLYRLKEIS